MNNICLFGLGLVGLIFLSSNNNNLLADKKTSEVDLSEEEESKNNTVFVNSNDQLEDIVNNLMSNKFIKVFDNVVVWEVPLDEIFNHELHPFVGFDYFKIDNGNNNMTTVGRYIEISDEFKEKINTVIPDLDYCHVLKYNNGKVMTLIKITDNIIPISAIKLDFIENVNRDLSVCQLKSSYKKTLKNYTCKNVINPPIEWFNLDLFNVDNSLYKELCDSEQTSLLETSQIMDTDLDSNTSEDNMKEFEYELDMTSDNNLVEINDIDLSKTSNDSESMDLSETSDNDVDLNEDLSDTSFLDTTMEDKPKASAKKASAKKASAKKASAKKASGKKASAKKASAKKASGKKASAKKASGKKASAKKASGKKASAKKASAKKASGKKASGKKASGKKASGKKASAKKASGKKKEKKEKKGKKGKKNKKVKGGESEILIDSNLEGGSSSSLYNVKKSILNRV